MPLPLTFDVEFEFALAIVLDDRFPLPDPSETQCLRFARTEGATKDVVGVSRDPTTRNGKDLHNVRRISNRTVAIHVGNTLKVQDPRSTSTTSTRIIRRSGRSHSIISFRRPSRWPVGLGRIEIEIKNRALFFSPDSIHEVGKVCCLLSSSYCTTLKQFLFRRSVS